MTHEEELGVYEKIVKGLQSGEINRFEFDLDMLMKFKQVCIAEGRELERKDNEELIMQYEKDLIDRQELGVKQGRELQKKEDKRDMDKKMEQYRIWEGLYKQYEQENTALKEQIASMQVTEEEAKVMFRKYVYIRNVDIEYLITELKSKGWVRK